MYGITEFKQNFEDTASNLIYPRAHLCIVNTRAYDNLSVRINDSFWTITLMGMNLIVSCSFRGNERTPSTPPQYFLLTVRFLYSGSNTPSIYPGAHSLEKSCWKLHRISQKYCGHFPPQEEIPSCARLLQILCRMSYFLCRIYLEKKGRKGKLLRNISVPAWKGIFPVQHSQDTV